MAKKAKYILSPAATGAVYPPKPLYERKDGGKFDLEQPLTQEDLEYLYENNYTNLIVKVEVQEVEKPKRKSE